MSNGIVVFGLNGSGKSTLGRAVANALEYKFMDIEDYVFLESEIPYTKQRSREEYLRLMQNDIREHDKFVLSAVKGDFGDEISSAYRLGVFIDVPYDIRIERVEQRMISKFGDRVKFGGDMYESEVQFLDFVKTRNVLSVEMWSETLECPIIRVDGTKEILDNVKLIEKSYLDMLACKNRVEK
ncbi:MULTISPECIES: AAA family ATPase [unclassified Fusibacter]|uniref:AAA family ATPase n=1 Tax=unclassified Fusibacter TaxID=2624464 RepID=UPI00101063AE|nr:MULTISPECIES: AAA family ATPase [unclassified Fusibacter]MCK8060726.1 AAA family ATPase [Fusibacter sp. A2]NPE23021.1 AAA family ATPase [Fusibacter sp. A1]RXV59695.1 hypothetical protein DWB64_14350 [Fusibacter sp. A1]